MKIQTILIFLLIFSCARAPRKFTQQEIDNETAKINQFFDTTFQEQIDRSPQTQTYLGIKKDYHLLNDNSGEMEKKEFEISKENLAKLKTFNFDQLNDKAKLSYIIFKKDLEMGIEMYQFRNHHFPVNPMFGLHTDLPSFMINMHTIKNKKDAEDYISRINLFPKQFDNLFKKLEIQKQNNTIAPAFVYPKAIQDAENLISGAPFESVKKNNAILDDFKNKISKLSLSKNERNKLIKDLNLALIESFKPSYEQLIIVLKKLEKSSPVEAPASSLPNGGDFYIKMLEYHTTTNMSPDEIHELGLSETKRIHEEMKLIMEKVKFKGDIKSFFHFLKTSKQFTFKNTPQGKQQYLNESKKIIDRMNKRLPEMFGILPKAPVKVKAVEPFREASAGLAFYEPASETGDRPGTYFVNLFYMDAATKYEMEALAYHEAIPGHHMQISIAMELTDIPRFRKHNHVTAYSEGWGLYAENLPRDYGFYQDPYSDFGRLAMELWRSARLVIDTGLHSKSWSIDQSVAWLDENTPSPHDENVRAVQRYIVMPGQATAYKIGMNKIMELKKYAQNKLGDKFDIKKFHDEVLKDGSVPLDVLEEKIYLWVNQ